MDQHWAAEEQGGAVAGARPEGAPRRARGPRKGFKHWTPEEDARLRRIVLASLDRLGTLQAIVAECHRDFHRDEGSVLRRIRHLRQGDPELDAAIASRVVRARALADENKGRVQRPAAAPAPGRGGRRRAAAAGAGSARGAAGPESYSPPIPLAAAEATGHAAAGADGSVLADARVLAQFLEDNAGPVTGRQRERLAGLVAAYGQVQVMRALADSLLHRTDVILGDVETRLRASR